jgi:PKD repeat protein
LVQDLKQETGATPVFPGFFGTNDNTLYPFFYEIPNIDHLPTEADKSYSLYITTIWKGVNHSGHPLAGQDEPMDQVKRSFAPLAYLFLEDVALSASQSTVSTLGNYVRNISSTFSITVQISLSMSDPKLSISPLILTFTLDPGEKEFFQLDFTYQGDKPSSDVIDTLTGQAFIQIIGSPILSHTNQAQIFIEKQIDQPTAYDLNVVPDYCENVVRVNWKFDDPDRSSQKDYQIQVDNNSDFSFPEVETPKINSISDSYLFQLNKLSWDTEYYWRIRVWCDNNTKSAWIYPPSHLGFPTLSPGDIFKTALNRFPYVIFDWSPVKPTGGEIIHFRDKSFCYDADNLCNSWLWNFGDGQFSTEQNPTHSYPVEGTSTVTLKVSESSDINGKSCYLSQSLETALPLPTWKEKIPL